MAVIAIYSVKGGVGKTTLAANLAWCSAVQSGHKTVIWDLDPSAGAGFLLGSVRSDTGQSSALFDANRNPRRLVSDTPIPNLRLLAADEGLRNLDRRLSRIGSRNRISKITQDLSQGFARILIDCPPVHGELSEQIIRAADLIIVPLPPSPLSTRAFTQVSRQVKTSTKNHPPILPVLSMVDLRRNLHRSAVEDAPNWPVIPFSSAAEQCAVRQQPVGAFAKSSPTAKAIAHLWEAIETKLSAMDLG